MRPLGRRLAALAIAVVGAWAVHGCTERLEGGRACPILCPGQNVELRDTLVAAVVLDTTVASYPPIGEEPLLALAWRGDTLETRVIVRFDTLPATYQAPTSPPTQAPIESVQDAKLRMRLRLPARRPDQTVTVEAYDVDTAASDGGVADTAAATMLPLFRPERFLGSLTFKPTDVAGDSIVAIPIDNAKLLAKIQARARLRIGLQVRAAESAELVLQSTFTRAAELSFRVSADPAPNGTTVSATPYSATPAERFIAGSLADFVIVAQRRAPETPPEVLTVGGVPGRRTYLRFELPRGIVDSTSVVRATLFLTRYPNKLASNGPDSISLYPQPVVASELVTDIQKQAAVLAPTFDERLRPTLRLDSLRTAPDDSGAVAIEVIGAIQVWRATQPERSTRALVLRIPFGSEGVGLDELYFFSTEAPAALRPRLRIVYVPDLGFGLP